MFVEFFADDNCSEPGAKRLKARIEGYWREREQDVDVRLVRAGFVSQMRSARTDVRSNMVNGLPPAAFYAKRRAA